MAGRAWLRRALLAIAAVVLVLAGATAIELIRIAADIRDARRALEPVEVNDLGTDALTVAIERARAELDHAATRARTSGWLRLSARVPVVSNQIGSLRTSIDAAVDAGGVAADLAASIADARLELRLPNRRLEALRKLGEQLDVADARLAGIDSGRRPWLPPASIVHDELDGQLDRARQLVDDGQSAVGAAQVMLGGPHELLVLAANNAEMRGGGGMILNAGKAHLEGGRVRPGPFTPTEDLHLDEEVPYGGTLAERYGWLKPGREWRNTTSTPDFSESAPVLARMAGRAGLGEVDTIAQVDVVALRLLLEVLGPVEAKIRIGAGDVEELVLHRAYVQLEDPDRRRRALGLMAQLVLQAFDERRWEPGPMAAALARAVAGRHVQLWSRDAALQDTWRRLHADGSLPADSLLVAIQNHGGNKLDWFIDPELRLTARGVIEGRRRVDLEIDVPNDVPEGEPPYVAGTGLDGLPPRHYRAFVTVYLPVGVRVTDLEGADLMLRGEDAGLQVVAMRVDIAPGTVWHGRLELEIPASISLRLEPAGRVRPTVVHVGTREFTDDRPHLLPI